MTRSTRTNTASASPTSTRARRSRRAARSADWCVCTIPLSILSQIPIKVGEPMTAAIQAVPYEAAVKVGLQFKRRFWEEDERIYGGISYTDLPIQMIGYPMAGYQRGRQGRAARRLYLGGPNAYEFTAMTPEERVRKARGTRRPDSSAISAEFENGVAVAWHRVPFTQGCFGNWSDGRAKRHYDNLCQIDGRIALAGEHASRLPAWQEGAVLSALDAIGRLHQRASPPPEHENGYARHNHPRRPAWPWRCAIALAAGRVAGRRPRRCRRRVVHRPGPCPSATARRCIARSARAATCPMRKARSRRGHVSGAGGESETGERSLSGAGRAQAAGTACRRSATT